mmetsp:Transcript_22196/g.54897  ORF Transcript_22196/g.54897 Transcript_22196/m.54897 type:complete len:139 (+) Transcript_22196:32-448(+)
MHFSVRLSKCLPRRRRPRSASFRQPDVTVTQKKRAQTAASRFDGCPLAQRAVRSFSLTFWSVSCCPQHEAGFDALLCGKLFLAMISLHENKQDTQSSQLVFSENDLNVLSCVEDPETSFLQEYYHRPSFYRRAFPHAY